MARALMLPAAVLGLRPALAAGMGDMCATGLKEYDGCLVDGTGCEGENVLFMPYSMKVGKWDKTTNTSQPYGSIWSYAIAGQQNTWEMYLHGPHFHERERRSKRELPPIYVYATFMNTVYRFDDFSVPAPGQPMRAKQKVVGKALAPSTGYIWEDEEDTRVKGMFIAEGQPFLVSNIDTWPPHESYAGGVQYMKNPLKAPANSTKESCTDIFPTDPVQGLLGQVVNTVDCHRGTGICFFSVWKFYDDQEPIWNKLMSKIADDCLWYCVTGKDAKGDPTCIKTEVVVDEHGEKICHKDGVGAVHGMTVGNTDASDPTKFDIFLVFTGKASMENGESSMKKVAVQAVTDGFDRSLKVVRSEEFAHDLFNNYAPKGWDVGGDHAWVDATGKHIWVSCFRSKGVGAHMLDYVTGDIIYSVTGLDSYVPGQYTYTAGIHGVGSLGEPGSYLAIATCSCHSLSMCIPTVPWHSPVPRSEWTTGVFFIVDLASMKPEVQAVVHV